MSPPIKPENRGRYPRDWKQIRTRILARAGNRCEWPGCRVENGAVGYLSGDRFIVIRGALEAAIRIVLTVAHLDHMPENCDLENLRAFCQRHHLRYDAKFHAANARKTREAKSPQINLFPEGISHG